MNWIPARNTWRKLGVRQSTGYLQEHWEKIKRRENGNPQFTAGGSGREGDSDVTQKRPVAFSLTATEDKTQHKPTTPALPEKDDNMKRNEAFPSKYLKAADLDGGDLTVTIDHLEWEEVGKEKTSKPVIHFSGKTKPWILNGTCWDKIVEVTGLDDSDDWDGSRITLFVTEVPFGREMVDAIRVRSKTAKKGKAKAEPEPPEVADPEDD
jgi:hypothetical protein